ncbi:MAG TPA: methyl-accepting chemotaxis protein [Clostridiaceae bacterium]|nr:methyl-accepting chemotaxis protein [Clostridiaceae bacterium]
MKSISVRIILLLGLLVFLICSGLGIGAFLTTSDSIINIFKETMPKFALEASIVIQNEIQNQLNTLSIIASLEVMEVLNEPDGDLSYVSSVLSREFNRAGHKRMILANRQGSVLYDSGSSGDIHNLNENVYFNRALEGENVVSDPMFDEDGVSVIIVYAVPVKINGEIAGALIAIRDGLELSEFANRIEYGESGEAFIINSQGKTIAHGNKNLMIEMIKTFAADTVSSATTRGFSGEEEERSDVATSATSLLVRDDGSGDKTGFRGFYEALEQMVQGKTGFEEYEYKGIQKVLGFAPIEGRGWSIGVAVDKEEALSGLSELRRVSLFVSLIFLFIGFVVAYFIGKSISKPIIDLTKQCSIMSEGNFTKMMGEKYTRRRDELGDLARGFNKINVNVSKIVKNVISETSNMSSAIEIADKSMSDLTREIEYVSDIIQQLSSEIQETSAMAEEMNATSVEIETSIDSISNKVQEGVESAEGVSKRADELKNNALDSQKSARDILLNVDEKLREAIEKSKAVEKISVLADVISKISTQTNILALNASIEASRAGDTGKGFAVVAEEIRKLAEHSKKTANEIQELINQVVDSVQNLSTNSRQVLDFLESKVVKDYDMLVKTGIQYSQDAQFIDSMMKEFSEASEKLYISVNNIVKAISDVAEAANEGASNISEMANEVSMIVKAANEVLEQTHVVSSSSSKLSELVSIFKV